MDGQMLFLRCVSVMLCLQRPPAPCSMSCHALPTRPPKQALATAFLTSQRMSTQTLPCRPRAHPKWPGGLLGCPPASPALLRHALRRRAEHRTLTAHFGLCCQLPPTPLGARQTQITLPISASADGGSSHL